MKIFYTMSFSLSTIFVQILSKRNCHLVNIFTYIKYHAHSMILSGLCT